MASTYFYRATAPNQPPTISLAASQLNGLAPVTITLTANPTAPSGMVSSISFYSTSGGVDTLLGSVTAAPYAFSYLAPVGTYTWKAVVTDSNNLSATSNVLSVAFTQVPTVTLTLLTQPGARYIRITYGDKFQQTGVAALSGGAANTFQTPVYTAQGLFRGLAGNGAQLTAFLDAMTDLESIGAYVIARIEPTVTGNPQGGISLSYQQRLPGRTGGQGPYSITTANPFDGTLTVPTGVPINVSNLVADTTAHTATFTLGVDRVASDYEFMAPGATSYAPISALPFAIGTAAGTLSVRRTATGLNPVGQVSSVTIAANPTVTNPTFTAA